MQLETRTKGTTPVGCDSAHISHRRSPRKLTAVCQPVLFPLIAQIEPLESRRLLAAIFPPTFDPSALYPDWSTYLGGFQDEVVNAIAIDSAGNIFVVGDTYSSGWTLGGYDTSYNDGPYDAFLAKFDSTGQFLWSTYLGGSDSDQGKAVALDDSGGIYVAGTTKSSGWISGGYDTTRNGGTDTFVIKLDSAGQPLWSTYLGGSGSDLVSALTVDSTGNIFLTGQTYSSSWISGGTDTTLDGPSDTFLMKLDSAGQPLWSTYLGGSGNDLSRSMLLDDDGNIYITGDTYSPGWVSGGYDTTFNSSSSSYSDGFLAKLDPTGQPLWSTYIGGTAKDNANAISLDSAANIYVAGQTASSGWTSGGFDTTYNGGTDDACLVKLDPSGNHLWSTYLGGFSFDGARTVSVDSADSVFVAGETWSANWVSGGYDTATSTYYSDGFLLELDTAGLPLWSTYVGGGANDVANVLAFDAAEHLYLAGSTHSPDWVHGGHDTTYVETGYPDGFLVKYVLPDGPPDTPTNLVATLASADGIDLQWDDNAADAYAYVVERRAHTETDWQIIAVLEHDTASYQDTSLPFLTRYHYRVRAINPIGDSGHSDGVTVRTRYRSDPVWSTYLGGTGGDRGRRMTTDIAGNLYIVGETGSPGWVSGGFDTTLGGYGDGYLAKLSSSGQALWSTFIGGSQGEAATDIAVDQAGNMYVTGYTLSPDWISGGYDTTFYSGYMDAFLLKLNPDGQPVWSTYIGGSGSDWGNAVAIDSNGDIYVAGYMGSAGWTSGGYDTTYNGGENDAFLVKFDPSGNHLWSTYLGGSGLDGARSIAIDSADNVYIVGETWSASWVAGGYDTTADTIYGDGFLIKLNSAGLPLWSTYIGGTANEFANALALDSAGDVYVAGSTYSPDFASGGFDATHNGSWDAFLAKLDAAGQHLWSTYLGGTKWDEAYSLTVDSIGNVFVVGESNSPAWIAGGFDTLQEGTDGFLVELGAGGQPNWSTFLGKGFTDVAADIVLGAGGAVYVTGTTYGPSWISGGYDTTFNGEYDPFLIQIDDSIVLLDSGTRDLMYSAANLSYWVSNDAILRITHSIFWNNLTVVDTARVQLPSDTPKTLHLSTLVIEDTATLDLADNTLLIQNATLPQVESWIKLNRLTSSSKTQYTALAPFPQPDNSILVKLTYTGDMNNDGVVNALDYFTIDSNFLSQTPSTPIPYSQGDLNFDDTINALDYFLIDSAFLGQSSRLAASMSSGLATSSASDSDRRILRANDKAGAPRKVFSTRQIKARHRSRHQARQSKRS